MTAMHRKLLHTGKTRGKKKTYLAITAVMLLMLATAAEVWSSAHPGEDPTLDALVGPDHYIRILPKCPAGGVYSLSKDGDKFVPHCSIPEHDKRGLAALKRLQ